MEFSLLSRLRAWKYYEVPISVFVMLLSMLICTEYIGHLLRSNLDSSNKMMELQYLENVKLRKQLGDFEDKTLVIRLQSLEDRLTKLQATEELKTQLYRESVRKGKKD